MLHFYWYWFKGLSRALLLPPMGLLVLTVVGAALLATRHRRSGWICLSVGLSLHVAAVDAHGGHRTHTPGRGLSGLRSGNTDEGPGDRDSGWSGLAFPRPRI